MMLAEISQYEVWTLVATLVMAAGTLGAFVIMIISFNRKQQVQFRQPVQVTINEELHKAFASKEAFDAFVLKTDEELAQQREILRLEIPEMVRQVNSSGEKRIRRVHARLDPLIIGVAQLCTKAGLKMPRPQDPIEPESDND